jgi:hypothetical protein
MARQTGYLLVWTVAWVASLALAKFGPGTLWTESQGTTLLVVAVNVLLGLAMLLANKRHLWALDEMQRTMQLHAMAWALGAGLVAGTSWKVMEGHGLVAFNAQISHLIMFMAAAYFIAVLVGLKRYL